MSQPAPQKPPPQAIEPLVNRTFVGPSLKCDGNGLFAGCDIPVGGVVLALARPMVAVIDNKNLDKACEWCFSVVEGFEERKHTAFDAAKDNPIFAERQAILPPGSLKKDTALKKCSACGVPRFCSTACQSASWKHHHKYECVLFKQLSPLILPTTVRMAVQVLYRHMRGAIAEEDWDEFMMLESHLEDFKKRSLSNDRKGREFWENLQLMTRAAAEYTDFILRKDGLSIALEVMARIFVNSLTLDTPAPNRTAIGAALSPLPSLFNHSCVPNTYSTFEGPIHVVNSVDAIMAGKELTTGYVCVDGDVHVRRAELKEMYCFDCNCFRCKLELGLVELPPQYRNMPRMPMQSGPEECGSKVATKRDVREDDWNDMPGLEEFY